MSVSEDVLGAVASAVSQAAANGQGVRASAKGLAYGLAGGVSIAAQLSAVEIEHKTYTGIRVTDTGTPAAVVAEGTPKPNAATTSTLTVDLKKYAGFVNVPLEALLYADQVRQVVTNVLFRQCVNALDTDIVAAMDSSSTALTSTASGLSAQLIDGWAQMADHGATVGVIALNPSDWSTVVGENNGGNYLNVNDPEAGPSGAFMGAALIPSSAVTAGKAFLIDRGAIEVVNHAESPIVFLSPMNTSNVSPFILDVVAAPVVTVPAGIGELTLTSTAAAATSTRSK